MENVNSNTSALTNANNSFEKMNSFKINNEYFIIEKHLSILPILLTIFGTTGNMIAFYVLTRKKLRVQSTMLYFASLTLMDTLSLYQWNFNFFYKYRINENAENLENQSIFLCRYISYMANFSVQSSAWILAVISIDRYLIVTNTIWKQKFSKNIKFNLTIITTIISFFALTNFPVTLMNGQVAHNNNNRTRIECYNTKFYKIWQKLVVLIDCIIPLALMIIFNCLLIYKTYKSSVKLDTQQKNRQRQCGIMPELYSCADLTQQNDHSSSPMQTQNNFNYYFEPFTTLSKVKSKNLFQHYCSLTVIPNEDVQASVVKSAPTSPTLSVKNRRYSDTFQDNISMKNFPQSPKSKYLTTDKIINYNLTNNKSSNNLAIASEWNLSRSMVSLADRPKSSTRNRKILLMLTLLTISFMVSTLPSSVFYAFFRTSLNNKPYRRLLSLIFNCLRHLSHAFNFIIYFTSSSIIKQQLKETLRDLKKKKLVKFLKEQFSCIVFDAKANEKLNGGSTVRRKTNTLKRDDLEDTSVGIGLDVKKDTPNELIEFKITNMNDINVINNNNNNDEDKSSFKDEIKNLINNKFYNNDDDNNKINNHVEFETISFKVPVISKKKVNRR